MLNNEYNNVNKSVAEPSCEKCEDYTHVLHFLYTAVRRPKKVRFIYELDVWLAKQS